MTKPRQDPFGPNTIPYDIRQFVKLIEEHYVAFPRALSPEEFKTFINLGLWVAVSLSCVDGGTWKGTQREEKA